MAKWDRLAIKNGSLRMIGDALALEPCRSPLIYIKDNPKRSEVTIAKSEVRPYYVMGDRPEALVWAPFYMYLHNRMTINATAVGSLATEKPISVLYIDEDGKDKAEQVNVGGEPLRTTSVFALVTVKIHFEEDYTHEGAWVEGSQADVERKYGVISSLPVDTHRSYDRYAQVFSTCSIDTMTGKVSIDKGKVVIDLFEETGYPFEGKLVLEGADFDVKMEDVEYPADEQ
jgi:hypothetical protein